MLSTPLRRALGAAAAVPVLVLSSAACSSDDDGGNTSAKPSGGGDDGGGGGEDGGGEDSEAKPLTKPQLKKALLKTGDVKGFKVQPSKGDVFDKKEDSKPDQTRCEPLTDTLDAKPKYPRKASEGASVAPAGASIGNNVHQVVLTAYDSGDASSWLDDMHAALESCGTLTKTVEGEQSRVRVEKGEKLEIGDDSVQFTLKNEKKGEGVPMTVTVLRSGANTVTVTSVAFSGEQKPPPRKLLTKQYKKLAAAAEA